MILMFRICINTKENRKVNEYDDDVIKVDIH